VTECVVERIRVVESAVECLKLQSPRGTFNQSPCIIKKASQVV
jgi:hypothetical protein